MLSVDMRIGGKTLGKMEIINLSKFRGKKTRYSVKYRIGKMLIETEVLHIKNEGALRLVEIVAKKLKKEMEVFFSLPKDKVINGAIKGSDIPERYRKAVGDFMGVHTCTMIDGEIAHFVGDIEGFLTKMKTGKCPLWD